MSEVRIFQGVNQFDERLEMQTFARLIEAASCRKFFPAMNVTVSTVIGFCAIAQN